MLDKNKITNLIAYILSTLEPSITKYNPTDRELLDYLHLEQKYSNLKQDPYLVLDLMKSLMDQCKTSREFGECCISIDATMYYIRRTLTAKRSKLAKYITEQEEGLVYLERALIITYFLGYYAEEKDFIELEEICDIFSYVAEGLEVNKLAKIFWYGIIEISCVLSYLTGYVEGTIDCDSMLAAVQKQSCYVYKSYKKYKEQYGRIQKQEPYAID